MHAKWRVPFVDEPERFWRMKHCYRPMDQLWFASPWHFPKDSPILGPVLSELRCFFEKRKEQYTRGSGNNVAYNYAMLIVHAKNRGDWLGVRHPRAIGYVAHPILAA